jgi:hypothetical protein
LKREGEFVVAGVATDAVIDDEPVPPRESGSDAVDGSCTGTRVPRIWAPFEAPMIRRS